MTLKGSCLCGGILFELRSPASGIIQCHCSLCRKVSGAGSIATLPVSADQFRWIAGEDLVAVYERPSGYGSAFCRICGSPAPDANRARTRYGIPAGLIENSPDLKVAEHICVGSKAHWEAIGDDGAPRFEADSPTV